MNNSSNLSGPLPISPVTGSVWKLQKDRRTEDRRNNKREYKDPEEKEDKDTIEIKGFNSKNVSTEPEAEKERLEPKTKKDKKKISHKVDILI